jgi:hypothetical protein
MKEKILKNSKWQIFCTKIHDFLEDKKHFFRNFELKKMLPS